MSTEDNNIDEILKRHLPSASQAEADVDCDHVLQNLRAQAQRRKPSAAKPRLLWFAMAAAAAIILTVFISPMVFRAAPAVLEVASRKVHFDEVVSSNVFGEVVVLSDGSRVEMRTDSELRLERADDGVRVRLMKGGVIVNAAKQSGGHLYVQTKDILVSAVGTVFLVNAEAEGSRVAVYEGEVRVQEGGKERKLRSGEQVATGPGMEPLGMKEAISWSRQAEVTAALLPQPAPVVQQAAPRVAFEEVSIRRTGGDAPPGVRGGNANINLQNGCSAGSAAEIDPARFAIFGKNFVTITAMAYFGRTFQACFYALPLGLLSGGDGWTRTDGWDIQAAIPAGAFTSSPTLRDPKLQKMLQTMLAERFKLVLKREMKEMPVYLMTLKDPAKTAGASDGVWLTKRPDYFTQEMESRQGLVAQEGPAVYGANATMTDLAQLLGRMVGRPVVDRTGFTRKFSFSLEYEFDASAATRGPLMGARNPSEIKSLIAEFEKQAGIKFESSKENVEVLVIDHAEKPSEN